MVGVLVGVLVLGVAAVVGYRWYRAEPVLPGDKVSQVFTPPLGGFKGQTSPDDMSKYKGSTTGCQFTAFIATLGDGDLGVGLKMQDGGGGGGMIVTFTTAELAKTAASSVDAKIMECTKGDWDHQETTGSPHTRTYTPQNKAGQMIVVQYSNTVTLLYDTDEELPSDLPAQIKKRIDELAA